ncbi:MAG TPA: hypothetical protein VLE48_09945 [Terriglobales bacterium]|nr:hypothetical protein [Terriglobales bacterium]
MTVESRLPFFAGRMSAARILVCGGILLIIAGMLLGEVYAIFISHVGTAEIKRLWTGIAEAVGRGDPAAAVAGYERVEEMLHRRGRIVNTHSHIIAFGFLALTLAVLQSVLPMDERRKRRLAILVITGSVLQPLFVFVRAYAGEWALWVSDLGGFLVMGAVLAYAAGLRSAEDLTAALRAQVADLLASASSRLLLRTGGVLIVAGMAFGLYLAWQFVTQLEPQHWQLLESGLAAARQDPPAARETVLAYRGLQSKIAITAAAHSHAIEMGIMALLLGFVQNFVFFSERWKLRWACVFCLGSALMPVFIFIATIVGLVSAAFADLSGALAIAALVAMLVGLVRHSGAQAAREGSAG